MTTLRKKILEALTNLKEDDGNPSLMQALDYNMDNDDILNDPELYKRVNQLLNEVIQLSNKFRDLGKKYHNKKVEKISDSLDSIMYKIGDEYLDDHRLNYNQYRMTDLSNINPNTGEWEYSYIDKQNTDYYDTPYGGFEKK